MGIMEKKMEATTLSWVYVGVIWGEKFHKVDTRQPRACVRTAEGCLETVSGQRLHNN